MSSPSTHRALVGVLAAAFGLAATPAIAQHEGHTMPAPRPATKPAPKPVAKKPAPRPATRPPAKPAASAVDHAAMGHGPAPVAKPAAKPARPAKAAAKKPARAPVRPAVKKPAASAPVDHAGMDHAAMGHGTTAPVSTTTPDAIDHAAMGHDRPAARDQRYDQAARGHDMPAAPDEPVDHAAMGHSPAATPGASGAAMEGMDHSQMSAADHAAMGHAGEPDLPADAAPRTPIPVLTDADRAAAVPPAVGHAVHDRSINSYWLVDRLEWQDTDEGSLGWEGLAWVGGDINRLWLRTEGEGDVGARRIESANAEILYGRSVSTWWDVVAGVRHDFGEGPSRTWAAFGVQGLAPYKFEVEATAYVGRDGHTAATVEAEYDTLITNRLVLQWQAEASLHGKDDRAVGIGGGLSTVEAGARLRYEFTRRFAPYVGLEYERAFGDTADFRRGDGEPTRDTRLVAGIRFWF